MADDINVIYYRHKPDKYSAKPNTQTRSREPSHKKRLMRQISYHKDKSQSFKTLYYDHFFLTREESPYWGCDNISVILTNNKTRDNESVKETTKRVNSQRLQKITRKSSALTTDDCLKILAKNRSTPVLHRTVKHARPRTKIQRSQINLNTSTPYRTKFAVNSVNLNAKNFPPKWQQVLKHPMMQAQLRIYRCQLSTAQESCCCSCNSDAMFEVIKGLYDCYKKKNCDNCHYVLCGKMSKEERKLEEQEQKLGEAQKSEVIVAVKPEVSAGLRTDTAKQKKAKEAQTRLGLPPEPIKAADKATLAKAPTTILTTLDGKTPEQKEKIVRGLAKRGLPIPEGKTASERKMIEKVKEEVGLTPKAVITVSKNKVAESKPALPVKGTPSEKLAKAKAAGFLTPLDSKTPEQKEKILRSLAKADIPLPELKTTSDKKLTDKVRKDLGLPPEPKTAKEKEQYAKALASGLITPLEGKTPEQKEKILKELLKKRVAMPEGKTPSEQALIKKVKAETKPTVTEKGIPRPEGIPASRKMLTKKIQAGTKAKFAMEGIPSKKLAKAKAAGLLTSLDVKSLAQKEKILRGLTKAGIPLPEPKTASEKALIDKVKAETKPALSMAGIPPEKLARAKAAGFLTTLDGKTPEQKEKILRSLAQAGLPLPEAKTPSEKKLMGKIREDIGLPPEPKTDEEKERYSKAQAAGLITPLEGKTPEQKETILRKLANEGMPLPAGKTAFEKALISKIKTETKAAGLITPLASKTPEQKEKILRSLAQAGKPLPEAKTPLDKLILDQVRKDLILPPEPKTPAEKERYAKAQAAGLVTPMEGKTTAEKEKILKALSKRGVRLPEGKTAEDKALIQKIQGPPALPPEQRNKLDDETKNIQEGTGPVDECICSLLTPLSERGLVTMAKAKTEGLLTPLEGKTPEQKAKILRSLAKTGVPLPEAKTPSEKKVIQGVRKYLGLPPEPKSEEEKKKYSKAQAAGLITALEGKTSEQKEKILKKLQESGVPLPEGKTPSEKALIAKIKAETKPALDIAGVSPQKLAKAKAAGVLTPLTGKTPKQKDKILRSLAQAGLPLPESKTPSEKKFMEKVREDIGLPPEPKTEEEKKRYSKAQAAGLITPLEGKTPEQKEKILKELQEKGIPLPAGKSPSEKALITKIKAETKPALDSAGVSPQKLAKAKAAGVLTPLTGKTPKQKEKILRSLAQAGLPLPESKTPSEKKFMEKVREDIGLPPEPKTEEEKKRYSKAQAAGLITPLEGKTPEQKEKILKELQEKGIPLPAGKSPSEKALITKIKAETKPALHIAGVSSKKLAKAKAAGLLTPLAGKTPEQKEKILRGLAQAGLPLPEAKTPSEKQAMDKVRQDIGLPPEPKTDKEKKKYSKAKAAGFITPLEGKTPEQKETILRKLANEEMPLPAGKTASKKALISKIKTETEAAGLITPLAGKTPEQKEKILRSLAQAGKPLPEAKTPSDKLILDQVRKDLILPPEPKTPAEKERYAEAQAAGLVTPLEGKTTAEKEKILKALSKRGVRLPEGKTAEDKALIQKIQGPPALPPEQINKLDDETKNIQEGTGPVDECICSLLTPLSERGLVTMAKAKTEGLLTLLEGKTPEQKAKILCSLAKTGVPLPEAKTPSEKKVIDGVRKDLGLPPETKTEDEKKKYSKEQAAGLVTPLEGKTSEQKEKILKKLQESGVPLPEGKTPSEKALIAKIIAETKPALDIARVSPQKLAKAKSLGLLTPLAGKTPEQKEKILRSLAQAGLPLPEAKTPSEKKLMDKVRKDISLPPGPKTVEGKRRYSKAQAVGLITPLKGKTSEQKEKILKGLKEKGIVLPEGKAPSAKALISIIKAVGLEGKTPEEKEKILRELAKAGLPLPEGKTTSTKDLISKVLKDMVLPPETTTFAMKEKQKQAEAAGVIVPLEGKTSAQKKDILSKLKAAGVELPEGRTPSEKALFDKIKTKSVAGLFTPLDGNTPSQKETILKKILAAGVSIPEGRTPSEKSIIRKVKAAERLTQSLKGKKPEEKEAIIKGLVKAGLPLPEGMTPSKRAISKKIQIAAGLPPTVTPSEKKKFVATKSGPAVKIKSMSEMVKGGAPGVKPAGIQEEIQEVVKKDQCDVACVCDIKKIRFKHSYVKIRITSPDISSFCLCPDECIPGVKAGVFTDNEGIKVTVGSAVGIPSLKEHRTTNNIENHKFNKHSFQTSILDPNKCESLFSLKISSIDFDISTDDSSSESTVYIYNSESDVSISDIKRALGLYKHRDVKREDSVTYTYENANRREKGYHGRTTSSKSPALTRQRHQTDNNSASSSISLYAIEKSSSSLLSGSVCSRDALNDLTSLARRLKYSTESSSHQQSYHKRYQYTDALKSPIKTKVLWPPRPNSVTSMNISVEQPSSRKEKRVQEANRRVSKWLQNTEFNTTRQDCDHDNINIIKDIRTPTEVTKSSSHYILVSGTAHGDGSSQISETSLQYKEKCKGDSAEDALEALNLTRQFIMRHKLDETKKRRYCTKMTSEACQTSVKRAAIQCQTSVIEKQKLELVETLDIKSPEKNQNRTAYFGNQETNASPFVFTKERQRKYQETTSPTTTSYPYDSSDSRTSLKSSLKYSAKKTKSPPLFHPRWK